MGILETRNLDFRNVILLSMNDDNFPGSVVTGTSFIPYNLRAAYALPTPEHHEGFTPTIFIVCCNGPRTCGCSIALMPMTRPPANRAVTSINWSTKLPSRSSAGRSVSMSIGWKPCRSRSPSKGKPPKSWPASSRRTIPCGCRLRLFSVCGLSPALLFSLRGPVGARRRDFGGGRCTDVRYDSPCGFAAALCSLCREDRLRRGVACADPFVRSGEGGSCGHQ